MAIVRAEEDCPLLEHLMDKIIPLLKEKAKRVVFSSDLRHEDEIIDRAKIVLCSYYKIPMKSPVFNEYSIEELLYESYLLEEMVKATKPDEEKAKDSQEKTVEVIKENSESLKSLFDELRIPEPSITDNLFSKEEQESWNKVMDKDGFF